MNSVPSDESRVPLVLGLTVTFLSLAVAAVVLRFCARLTSDVKLWWDDWLALFALVCAAGVCSGAYYGISKGFGLHLATLPHPLLSVDRLSKTVFAIELPFNVGITAAKLSVLFFYARIFRVSKNFRIALWITGTCCTMWMVALMFETIFQCIPLDSLWDNTTRKKCINIEAGYIWTAVTDLLLDLVILFLPHTQLWGLKMRNRKKVGLGFLFLVGYCTFGITIYRIVTSTQFAHQSEDFSWDLAPLGAAYCAEIPIAVISVSLPAIFPLAKKAAAKAHLGHRRPSEEEDAETYENVPHNGFVQLQAVPSNGASPANGSGEHATVEPTNTKTHRHL